MNNNDSKPTINNKNIQTVNGYKKTAIGTIPEDWQLKKLFEICNFTNGKGHEQIIETSGKYILVNSKFVSTQGMIFKTIDTNLCPLKKNDITIVMSDVPNGKAIAKCFYVDKDDLYSLNQRVGNISINPTANSKFIYYQLNRNKYYLKFDDGIKQTNLRKDEVLNCPILFPPLLEQDRIAEILSTWDDAIAKCKTTIISLKNRNIGLAQQLLSGKKRLNGFCGEWKKEKLEKYLVKHNEKSNFSSQYPVLTSSRKGIFLQTDYYTREVASEDNTGYNVVPRGYFTYRHMSDDLIFKFNINDIVDKGIVSTLYPVFTVERMNKYFLLFKLNDGIEFKIFAKENKQGGSRTYIYFSKLIELKMNIPTLEEQTAIVKVLETANQELKSYETKLEALQLQKKGLMQQLLTGKIRVNVK